MGLASVPSSVKGDQKVSPTSHWKSTYNGAVEESL